MAENQDNEDLLARWMTGELTDQEKSLLNEPDLSDLRVVVDDISQWKLPEVKKQSFFDELDTADEVSQAKVVSFRPWMAVAASVAVILMAVWYWSSFLNADQQYITGVGERMDIALPDGSMVMLDAMSELRYNSNSYAEERLLQLTGQAFFEVQQGDEFAVETTAGIVKVLGTKFNVFSSSQEFIVSCYEGLVSVTAAGNEVRLSANEESTLKDGQLIKGTFDAGQPGWVAGQLIYSGESLQSICEELSRYYEVNIALPVQYQRNKYTGSLPLDDLEDALKRLFLPMQIDYVLSEDGKVTIE